MSRQRRLHVWTQGPRVPRDRRRLKGSEWEELSNRELFSPGPPRSLPEVDCSTCRHRNNGMRADYCYHPTLEDRFLGDGRPILKYPMSPLWCPGYEREDPEAEPDKPA